MRELLAEEFRFILPSLVIAFVVIIYYRERQIVRLNSEATFWPRFYAPSVYAVVLWPMTGILPMLITYFSDMSEEQRSTVYSITAVLIPIYSIVMHGSFGATVGKMVCKVVVLDSKTKNRIGYKQAFLRDSVPIVLTIMWVVWASRLEKTESPVESWGSYAVPIIYAGWFVVETVTMLTNRKRRAIHDFIAGSVVQRRQS